MIKLTLKPEKESTGVIFESKEIIIGNSRSKSAHFKIADRTLSDVHLKITQDASGFFLSNVANDPFTSLNGMPFGKKEINHQDLIEIKDHQVLFEVVEMRNEEGAASNPSRFENKSQENKQQELPRAAVSRELTDALDYDIDALLKEMDQLDKKPEPCKGTVSFRSSEKSTLNQKKESPETQNQPESPPFELGDSPPIESSALHEKEDRQEEGEKSDGFHEENRENPVLSHLSENWKMLAGFLFLIIAGTILAFGVTYFRERGKNGQEEKKIAAGIADIAMAMTHAQLKKITPKKLNWAEPDFIENNLNYVLSPHLRSQIQWNAQGQFTHYPYILRVYTSDDMSRFIVLAQPAPNFLQWLVHKKTIVIDSSMMEIRKMTDLKQLNRLLAEPNPFSEKTGAEISQVIKEGSLMSLASLSGKKNNWGFDPPKTLAFIRPGAENYIYNAPRYYPFGEKILQNAAALTSSSVTSAEVSAFQEEFSELQRFPNMVLYTSKGLQYAIEAQTALFTFLPSSHFLVGYIMFNNKGYVTSSQLLMNKDLHETAILESHSSPLIEQRSEKSQQLTKEKRSLGEVSAEETASRWSQIQTKTDFIDRKHPLYLRLHAIQSSRMGTLNPKGEEISRLILQQNEEFDRGFNKKISFLLEEYLKADKMCRAKIVQELSQLYREYSEMPLEEFMRFIEASKLRPFIDEVLRGQKKQLYSLNSQMELINQHITQASHANSLAELDDSAEETLELLNLDRFPDPERLIMLQEEMRNVVLEKLVHFLLAPDSIVAHSQLDDRDRATLIRILKSAWINDPDEVDFFLEEFERVRGKNGKDALQGGKLNF